MTGVSVRTDRRSLETRGPNSTGSASRIEAMWRIGFRNALFFPRAAPASPSPPLGNLMPRACEALLGAKAPGLLQTTLEQTK